MSDAGTQQIGPIGYENWRAALAGAPCRETAEVFLYTDARITGSLPFEILPAGCPYAFLNTLGSTDGHLAPAVALRFRSHLDFEPSGMDRTDTSRFHGGGMTDEIASIAALAMGVRLRAGGLTRLFWGDDQAGSPRVDDAVPALPPPSGAAPRVRSARGPQQLNAALARFMSYPRLAPNDAVTLVRSARLYRDALWVVEAEPELAWLFFVSALEAAATPFHVQSSDAAEVLRSAYPKLAELLDQRGGAALVEDVAAHLHRLLKARARFLRFVLAHLPEPPPGERPHLNVGLSWEPEEMKRTLDKIYEHRSRALHDGTPFPPLMSDPPTFANWERDPALAASMKGGTWLKEDMPMYIHVFEYITRGVLLKWWDSVAGGEPPVARDMTNTSSSG